MKKIYSAQKNELSNNKKYLLFSVFISIYVFLPQVFIFNGIGGMIGIFVSFFVLFLLSKVSKIIFSLVSFFTLFTNSIILHIVMHWGNHAVVPRIQAALLSPGYEAFEYLNTYLDFRDAFVLLFFLLGVFLLYKLLTNYQHSYKIIRITSLSFLLIIILMLTGLHKIKSLLPYKYVDKVIIANEWKGIVTKRNEYLKTRKHHKKTKNIPYDKIVIIMGESANKHHMEIYDYNISTTPFLSKLIKEKNCYKFDNIIAPSNQTRYAVPMDLTNATVHHFYDFITSESIISEFKNYGFKTYWLSNQFSQGMHDSYISSIAYEADYKHFTNFVYEHGGQADTDYDMVLLDQLNKIHINPNSKELYIFHLIGSHFQYEKRYPISTALIKNPKNIIEKYDNTIFYTDTVIEQIYNKFKDTKLLFIYLSDHAQVVNLKRSGHGFFPTYSDEYDIPLVVYSSFKNKRLLNLKKENEHSLFNMESFNHMIKYITDIEENTTKISHNPHIFALDPKNIENYKDLKSFAEN